MATCLLEHMKNLSLYIHIPFCCSKCKYCDFVSFVCPDKMPEYVDALIKEIEIYGKRTKDCVIKTIYLGGGTPSVLPLGFIKNIMNAIKTNFTILNNCEISIELNPNSVDENKLKEYKNCGINRISIGAQSVNDELLKVVGRAHTSLQFEMTLELVKEYFNNINVDVMIGLPNQTKKDVCKILEFLFLKDITHISFYSLILEEGTPLFKMVQDGDVKLPSEDFVVELYDFGVKKMLKNNFLRYEVSNFAKSGWECKHNLRYWGMEEYLGLGVSAHSFFEGNRFFNVSSLEGYIKSIAKNKLPISDCEKPTTEQLKQETIMLGLRTREGIAIERFNKEFNCDFLKEKQDVIDGLMQQNLIEIKDGKLRVKDEAMYVMDSIVLKLV